MAAIKIIAKSTRLPIRIVDSERKVPIRLISTGALKIGSSSTDRTWFQENQLMAPNFTKFTAAGKSAWAEKSLWKPAIGLSRSQLKLMGSDNMRNRL